MRWFYALGLAIWGGGSLAQPAQADLVQAAAGQVGVTVIYDPSYQGLDFPGGDIPLQRGVCSDVIIRAMRDAWDIDLQLAMNRDMKADFAAYPTIWGLQRTDRNIDHRRVPNLETLFTRVGAALPISTNADAFLPGDVVSFRLRGNNLPHIGIVADQRTGDGNRPLVTHNIGWGTRTDDMLFDHRIVGHFRLDDTARAQLMSLTR